MTDFSAYSPRTDHLLATVFVVAIDNTNSCCHNRQHEGSADQKVEKRFI
jgi:hypothetical protein